MSDELFNPDDNIMGMLGLGAMPEEERATLLDQMSDLVQKRVIIRVMEKLSPEEAKAAEQLADKPDQLAAYLSEKVPDMAAMLDEEVLRLKSELSAEAEEKEPAEE